MKPTLILKLAVVSSLLLISSCVTRLKPLGAESVRVSPQPLELRGGKVSPDINFNIPSKWFAKKATLRITPVLRYAGGEAWGQTTVLQGENVRANGISVPYEEGMQLKLQEDFSYKPEMHKSELYLVLKAGNGNKSYSLPDLKIAEGVLATEALASYAYVRPAIAPDAFQRIIKQAYDTNILFLIQQAGLRPSELNKEELKEWQALVQNAEETPNQQVDVEIQAYASPDGGLELNERLAEEREKNTSRYLRRQMQRQDITVPISAAYTAEDWEGFKQLVEKSELQDKELVLRVLSMYKDPAEREREIKNISSVFKQLAEDILPQLRRSRLIANVKLIGKSDEEIKALYENSPEKLSVEELLYTARLTENPEELKRVYERCTKVYPRDPRAWNNLGAIAYGQGDYQLAERYIDKAIQLSADQEQLLAEAKLNAGLIRLSKGELEAAENLFGQAGDIEAMREVQGLLHLQRGEYAAAASLLKETPTNNAVLAQLLSRDYKQAMTLLERIGRPDARTFYLQALLGARTDNKSLCEEGIRQALALNPSLAQEFVRDREFAKYISEPFFRGLLK